jgi:hypothetical protein
MASFTFSHTTVAIIAKSSIHLRFNLKTTTETTTADDDDDVARRE